MSTPQTVNAEAKELEKAATAPEEINAAKDPPKTKTLCEFCGKEFEQYDNLHHCPDCLNYYNRKRDWKIIIGVFASLFALIQAPLLQLIYTGIGGIEMMNELKTFLMMLFGGLVVIGFTAYQKMAGTDAKEKEKEITELKHKLDLNTQKTNLTENFNTSLVERLVAINKVKIETSEPK